MMPFSKLLVTVVILGMGFYSVTKAQDSVTRLNRTIAQIDSMDKEYMAIPEKDREPFYGSGYYRIFNLSYTINKNGVFKRRKLIIGKKYFYDEDKKLKQIQVFAGGKYVGDAPLSSEIPKRFVTLSRDTLKHKGRSHSGMEDTTYTIYENSAVNAGYSVSIIRGKATVFEYYYQSPDYDQTMEYDAGHAMRFLFEVDTLNEHFILKDFALVRASTVFSSYCHCPPNLHEISKGTITGDKLENGDWRVEINVVSVSKQQEYPVHAVGIFKYN